jgi:hypothetical protein
MRTYKVSTGYYAGQTVTVQELIDILKRYPGDMPVFATWEGVLAYVDPVNFAIEDVSKHGEPEIPHLVIDVNDY